MRLRSVPLTSDNIDRCRNLWGDRLFYSDLELEAVITRTRAFLADGRARGTLIEDDEQRPRYFGLTVFVRERAAEALATRRQSPGNWSGGTRR